MRGDVVLYKTGGSWMDGLIERFTSGPYVHVEIDLGNGQFIGAHNKVGDSGIVMHGGYPGRNTATFTPPASSSDIEYGLSWAIKQVGKEYGWFDIISNGIKIVGIPLEMGQPGHWDCSDFVTRYLLVARAATPLGKLAENPGLVSPNDIARAYGIK